MITCRRLLAACKAPSATEHNKRPFLTSTRVHKQGPFGFAQKLQAASNAALSSAIEGASKLLGKKVPPPRAPHIEKTSPVAEQHQSSHNSHEYVSSLTHPSEEYDPNSATLDMDEKNAPEKSSKLDRSITSYNRPIMTSHMIGNIQRIAYHLMFRPVAGKASGKLPIQVATLAPTHSLNSLASVLHSVVSGYNPDAIIHLDTAPLRTVCIIVPSESYKFQALDFINAAQIRSHRSWVLLTEDEFWCALFPGYRNDMTPYIESTGCVVLPHGVAAQKFVDSVLPQLNESMSSSNVRSQSTQSPNNTNSIDSRLSAPSKSSNGAHYTAHSATHFTQRWSQALDINAKNHRDRVSQMSAAFDYDTYSARELISAIMKPDSAFDRRMRLPRLQHAVQALKATELTDVMAFNTSSDTLSLLSTLHGLVGEFHSDSALPDFLAPFHASTPLENNYSRPKRQEWMPNMSFALDYLTFSNVPISYLSLHKIPSNDTPTANLNSSKTTDTSNNASTASILDSSGDTTNTPQAPQFVEKMLEHHISSIKCASQSFWDTPRSNPVLSKRASTVDPLPAWIHSQKLAFRNELDKGSINTELDRLFHETSHLELTRETIPEAVPLLLSAASHALSIRDTPAVPLRILCQHNTDLVAVADLLEMHGIPTISQNLLATPAARMLSNLMTILIELSKQSVVTKAKKAEKEALKKASKSKSTEGAEDADDLKESKRPRKKSALPKSELHWTEGENGNVNLAAAFHSLLNGAYGFDTTTNRRAESRIMYQFIKYQDPIMSLLLGLATDSKYVTLNPQEMRKKYIREAAKPLINAERTKMMNAEVDNSIKLATEDAELMLRMLKSPHTPYRIKALASEILRLQQAWAKKELTDRKGMQKSDSNALEAANQELLKEQRLQQDVIGAEASESAVATDPPVASDSTATPSPAAAAMAAVFEQNSASSSNASTAPSAGASAPSPHTQASDTTAESTDEGTGPKKKKRMMKRERMIHKKNPAPTSSSSDSSAAATGSTLSFEEQLYSSQNSAQAIEGAKFLYQDLAYLIGAIRAMPLTPSEIIDLYIARHTQRHLDAKEAAAELKASRQNAKNAANTSDNSATTVNDSTSPSNEAETIADLLSDDIDSSLSKSRIKKTILEKEFLSQMRAFSATLKDLAYSSSPMSSTESSSPHSSSSSSSSSSKSTTESDSSSASSTSSSKHDEVLTEHYLENTQHMQKALQFVKHAFVETPSETLRFASKRAQETMARRGPVRYPYAHPVFFSLDNFADNSGDFAITIRLANEANYNEPQPALLPPPSFFGTPTGPSSLSTLYSRSNSSSNNSFPLTFASWNAQNSNSKVSSFASSAKGPQSDMRAKSDWEGSKLRRLMASTLLYSFTASKAPFPWSDGYPIHSGETITLQTLSSKLGSVIGAANLPDTTYSLYFDQHPSNNPNDSQLETYFTLPEGVVPTDPSVSPVVESFTAPAIGEEDQSSSSSTNVSTSTDASEEIGEAEESKSLSLSSSEPRKKTKLADLHPIFGIPKQNLPPVVISGPSFAFYTWNRPYMVGSSSVRAFRDCQILYALRYVWAIEPGSPASIHTAAGMALHEAASKVHTEILEKLAKVLKDAPAPASPTTINLRAALINKGTTADTAADADSGSDADSAGVDASGEVLPSSESTDSAAATVEIEVSTDEAKIVHDTFIEGAFKTSVMQAQGLTSEEADILLAKPEYRLHVERAKKQTMFQWAKEKEKQEEMAKKLQAKKEKLDAERLEKAEAKALAKAKARAEAEVRAKLLAERKKEKEAQRLAAAAKGDAAVAADGHVTDAVEEEVEDIAEVGAEASEIEVEKMAVSEDGEVVVETAKDGTVDAKDALEDSKHKLPEKKKVKVKAVKTKPSPGSAEDVDKDGSLVVDEEALDDLTEAEIDAALIEEAVSKEAIHLDEKSIGDLQKKFEEDVKVELAGMTQEEVDAKAYSFSEKEFSFVLPSGQIWRGAWDRIDIDPETGEVEITEYKTSLKKNRESGLFQLQTYALAYWKLHHVIPSKLTLSALAKSQKEEYIPTKLDLIRTENFILNTLRRMSDGLYLPTSKTALCSSCLYSLQCPSALTASPLYLSPLHGRTCCLDHLRSRRS